MRYISLVLFLFSHLALAENVWIHAVGIDELHPTQNYSTFYRSAVDFNEKCASSGKSAECHLLINDDPKNYSPNEESFPTNTRFVESIPKNQSYFTYLQNKVMQAHVINILLFRL